MTTEQESLSWNRIPYLPDIRASSKVEAEHEGRAPALWTSNFSSATPVKRARKCCSRKANKIKGYHTFWWKTQDGGLAFRGPRPSKHSERMLKQNLDEDYKSIAKNRDGINRNQSIAIMLNDVSR